MPSNQRPDSDADIIQRCARRFDIEHSFRDQKDWRFGLALEHMTLGTPGRRDRMLLMLALATMFAVLTGAAGEQLGVDRLLRANTTRKCTHSLLRQGRDTWLAQPVTSPPTSNAPCTYSGMRFDRRLKLMRFFEGIPEGLGGIEIQPCRFDKSQSASSEA